MRTQKLQAHYSAALIVLLSMSLTGCTTHPLLDDVTPDNTMSIVNKIRCEFKYGLQEKLISKLKDYRSDPRNEDTLKRLSQDPNFDIGTVKESMVSKQIFKEFNQFTGERLGLDFSFTMSVLNAGSSDAKFSLPFTGGAFGITINGGTDLTRKNVRTIKLAEEWGDVIKQDCEGLRAAHDNKIYPITGEIGMDEIVGTYWELLYVGGERRKKDQTFSEKLTFTTKILGGVKPVLELKPVTDKLKLVNANGNFGATRTDEHDVTILLSKPIPQTEDLTIPLPNNAKIVVKVPKSKSATPKSPGSPTVDRPLIGTTADPKAAEQGRQQMILELNRLNALELNRELLETVQ